MVRKLSATGERSSRRQLLKSIPAVGLAGQLGGVVAGKQSGSGVTVLTRQYDDPISTGEINHIRARKFEEVGPQLQTKPDLGVGTPDGSLVAYVAGVDESGVLRQSIGVANRPRDVDKAHREAHDFASQLGSGSTTTTTSTSGSFTTQESTSWTMIEDTKQTNFSDPYGDVVSYYKWMYNDDDIDAHAYKERFAMFPGVQEYGSNWESDHGHTLQSWSQSDPSSELMDWDPFGGTNGTISQSFTIEGTTSGDVGVAYTYEYNTKETEVDDQTSDRENDAKFTVNFSGDSRTQTAGFEPSSLAEYTGGDITTWPLLAVRNDAWFYNPVTLDDHKSEINLDLFY